MVTIKDLGAVAIVSLVLEGLLVVGTGVGVVCFAVAAATWNPVDTALINRADNAGSVR